MNNISQQAQVVLDLIKKHGPIRPQELSRLAGISSKNLYKHLNKLQEQELIKKNSGPRQVFYLSSEPKQEEAYVRDADDLIIEQNYIYASPSGEITRGVQGFAIWCQRNKFDFEQEKKIYSTQWRNLQKSRKNGVFSGRKSILSGRGQLYLDDIFFADFYTFGHYGKTKLGQLVYLGKSGQDVEMIKEIAKIVRPTILKLLDAHNIGSICFIPPTIDRKIQFMSILKQRLDLGLSEIKTVKVPQAKVAQKTLKKLEDRIENARDTIAVSPEQEIDKNVLIIDDATGSGATLNETARKIKNIAKLPVKVFGFSVVGSYKGFDVISEV